MLVLLFVVDGGFTTWTAWDTCTVTCAGGTQDRTRTCTNPAPQYLGADCVGDTSETQDCNTFNCPSMILEILFEHYQLCVFFKTIFKILSTGIDV